MSRKTCGECGPYWYGGKGGCPYCLANDLADEIERLRALLRDVINVHSVDLCESCRDAIHTALGSPECDT